MSCRYAGTYRHIQVYRYTEIRVDWCGFDRLGTCDSETRVTLYDTPRYVTMTVTGHATRGDLQHKDKVTADDIHAQVKLYRYIQV